MGELTRGDVSLKMTREITPCGLRIMFFSEGREDCNIFAKRKKNEEVSNLVTFSAPFSLLLLTALTLSTLSVEELSLFLWFRRLERYHGDLCRHLPACSFLHVCATEPGACAHDRWVLPVHSWHVITVFKVNAMACRERYSHDIVVNTWLFKLIISHLYLIISQ